MNIRKTICIIMCAAIIGTIAGCGNGSDNRTASTPSSVSAVLKNGIDAQNEETESGDTTNTLRLKAVAELGTVDVDLTALSSTVVYSEVYNMTNTPDEYKGKVIKMGGQCTIYHDETTGKDYYACVIQDAAACCSQGIEFTLTDDYIAPDDYPHEGDEISVVGVFDTYTENGMEYNTLTSASLVA